MNKLDLVLREESGKFHIAVQLNGAERTFCIACYRPDQKPVFTFGITPEHAIMKMSRLLSTGQAGPLGEDFYIYPQSKTLNTFMSDGYPMAEIGRNGDGNIYCRLTGEANLSREFGDTEWINKLPEQRGCFPIGDCLLKAKPIETGILYDGHALEVTLEINPDGLPHRRILCLPVMKVGHGDTFSHAVSAAIAAEEKVIQEAITTQPATLTISLK